MFFVVNLIFIHFTPFLITKPPFCITLYLHTLSFLRIQVFIFLFFDVFFRLFLVSCLLPFGVLVDCIAIILFYAPRCKTRSTKVEKKKKKVVNNKCSDVQSEKKKKNFQYFSSSFLLFLGHSLHFFKGTSWFSILEPSCFSTHHLLTLVAFIPMTHDLFFFFAYISPA